MQFKFIGHRSGILGNCKYSKRKCVSHYRVPSVAAAEPRHNPLIVCRTDGHKTLYCTENRGHDSSESVKRVIPKITRLKSGRGGACRSAP